MPLQGCGQKNPDFGENLQRKLPDLCQQRYAGGQKKKKGKKILENKENYETCQPTSMHEHYLDPCSNKL